MFRKNARGNRFNQTPPYTAQEERERQRRANCVAPLSHIPPRLTPNLERQKQVVCISKDGAGVSPRNYFKVAGAFSGPFAGLLPRRPERFDSIVGMDEKPAGVRLEKGPTKRVFLGDVEWSWSPIHSRRDSYYVSRGRTHWLLWNYWLNDWEEAFCWTAVGHVPLGQASIGQAAVHLLIELLNLEALQWELDHWHCLGDTGLIDPDEWAAIGTEVWPDD